MWKGRRQGGEGRAVGAAATEWLSQKARVLCLYLLQTQDIVISKEVGVALGRLELDKWSQRS